MNPCILKSNGQEYVALKENEGVILVGGRDGTFSWRPMREFVFVRTLGTEFVANTERNPMED